MTDFINKSIELENSDFQLDHLILSEVQLMLELSFPEPFVQFYLQANGGRPNRYMFITDDIELAINDVLPLISKADSDTAIKAYEELVINDSLPSKQFFPFAVDPGGEYFLVDCGSSEGSVYFLKSDCGHVIKISRSFNEFLDSLSSE